MKSIDKYTVTIGDTIIIGDKYRYDDELVGKRFIVSGLIECDCSEDCCEVRDVLVMDKGYEHEIDINEDGLVVFR